MNTNIFTIVSSLIGVAGGGLITFFVSRHFYKKDASELKTEATELRRLTTLMLRGQELDGPVEHTRDEAGEMVGLKHQVELSENLLLEGTLMVSKMAPEPDTSVGKEDA